MSAPFADVPMFELVVPEPDATLSLAEQFEVFHKANPHVAQALERLAEQWFTAGHQRVGVKALWERLRWEVGILTSSADYRLNNNWTAFYARVLIERRPEWTDRIRTREQKAA